MIPVLSPHAAYINHRVEYDTAYRRVMDSGRYILGDEVRAFEAEFAAQFNLGEAIGVASGTEALWLALWAVGVGAGHEVIVPALTASATVAAIIERGARPVFADVAEHDLNIDPGQVMRLVTPQTRAVVAVHLYGHPADLTALSVICSAHGLKLVEDCAQGHGAQHAGRWVGGFGDAAAWSFYPTKNLGAFGDGGLVTTQERAVAERVRALREYGWRARHDSAEHGWNSRLDELQAAFLRVRLAHLVADNARRRAIAVRYRAALPEALLGPVAHAGDVSAEHLFVVRHARREALRAHCRQAGVETAIHYPVPVHLQAAYRGFGGGPGSLPITERAAAEVVSLPMYAELSDDEVARVVEAVRDF